MEQTKLKQLLKYDPLTGEFFWRTGTYKGKRAGSTSSLGYRKIVVDGREYQAHRLAVLYMKGTLPSTDVDHMNCQRHDNRWINLRVVSRAVNGRNRSGANTNNQCGFIGAHEFRPGKWAAQISLGSKAKLHLGVFVCPEAASTAYLMAKEFYFGNS